MPRSYNIAFASAVALACAGSTTVAAAKGGAKTIIDLQEFKQAEEQSFADGDATGKATLVNLNPYVNSWYLLKIRWPDAKKESVYHLENPDSAAKLTLPADGKGLVLDNGKEKVTCDVWEKDTREALRKTIILRNAYTSLCEGKIYVRTKIDGRKTTKEWVVEFLRDNIWGGEELATFVKEKILKDHFLIKAETTDGDGDGAETKVAKKGPAPAKIDPKYDGQLLAPEELGLTLKFEKDKKMKVGRWHEHATSPGVFVSMITPGRIDPEILTSHPKVVAKLDSIESGAIAYLVAFDMSRFELGFAVGTDHPRLDWAARALPESVDKSVPGPDGINDWQPLATSGMVNPAVAKRVVAAFTGGFKRDHGAFKWGKLASVNGASHYGFVEHGVVFSKLQPDLSTLFVTQDGLVEMRTWKDSDSKLLKVVRHARQNGVPIIEHDDATGVSEPGALVKNWGGGNWSGSEDSKFRTLRAGVCMHQHGTKQYLVYGYFSSVTPSAMARVFQAYDCRYAMHLDMNALEHTYLAVYAGNSKQPQVEHLISGMKVLDKSFNSRQIPRFIGFPDNRDFFYLMRKKK